MDSPPPSQEEEGKVESGEEITPEQHVSTQEGEENEDEFLEGIMRRRRV